MSAMNNTTITLEDFFSECYLQYYDIIKRYITFRIDNSYEAEDLVQDVFISLLGKWLQVQDGEWHQVFFIQFSEK